MKLLPHRYKKIGLLIVPAGLCLWLAMQFGYINALLHLGLGTPQSSYISSAYHIVNVTTAILGLFSFLTGLYFISFSKEKVEDEMIQKTRSDSFQFAAILQIVFGLVGFIYILFAGDTSEGGMMMFFIALLSLFWLSFIGRFNYLLHVRYRQKLSS